MNYEKFQKWYKKNKEHRDEYMKEYGKCYREQNKEKRKEYMKVYMEKYKLRNWVVDKIHKLDNKEEIKERQKEWRKGDVRQKWLEDNREHIRERNRYYYWKRKEEKRLYYLKNYRFKNVDNFTFGEEGFNDKNFTNFEKCINKVLKMFLKEKKEIDSIYEVIDDEIYYEYETLLLDKEYINETRKQRRKIFDKERYEKVKKNNKLSPEEKEKKRQIRRELLANKPRIKNPALSYYYRNKDKIIEKNRLKNIEKAKKEHRVVEVYIEPSERFIEKKGEFFVHF